MTKSEQVQNHPAALIAAYHEGIESLKQEWGTCWADAPETDKLTSLVGNEWVLPWHEWRTLPGTAMLEAIEREVDVADLPPLQQQMLRAERARLDASKSGGPHSDLDMDRTKEAVCRIAGICEFDGMLARCKESERRPWAEMTESRKVKVLTSLICHSTPPGAYALEAIEREVDYERLPRWRRGPLEDLRARLDRSELHGAHPDPANPSDRAGHALRIAELEATIEDYKQYRGTYDREAGRWDRLSEADKLGCIMQEIENLYLRSEPSVYKLIDREVDLARVPEDARRDLEQNRQEAMLGTSPPTPDQSLRKTLTIDLDLDR